MRLTFDFSMMRVYLPLDRSFPAYQKLKRKLAREKMSQKKAALKDVVDVGHKRDYVSGAALDWSISANPVGNLTNKTGLPASPFRSDDWEE